MDLRTWCRARANAGCDVCRYVLSRRDAEKMALQLSSAFGVRARPYHAQLSDDERSRARHQALNAERAGGLPGAQF